MPALVLNTILATALIAFDAAGDPLTLSTMLALLSTFVSSSGVAPSPVVKRRVAPMPFSIASSTVKR